MHDIRPSGTSGPNGAPEQYGKPEQPAPPATSAIPAIPVTPATPASRFPNINLFPDYAGRATEPTADSAAPAAVPPEPESTLEPVPEPTVPAQPAAEQSDPAAPERPTPGLPQTDEHLHRMLAGSLRTIKFGLLALIAVLTAATLFFLSQSAHPSTNKTTNPKAPAASPGSQTVNGAASGYAKSVNCFGQTGPDATTDKQTFVDVEGTECSYRTSTTKETLVLTGKLTGRNTEGTGMSVNINVNGKLCNGGESLNYARTYTPMISNCVFEVPANSSVAIKWQFLSPFGGSASVLRSSKNIAPSITGVAIPKPKDEEATVK